MALAIEQKQTIIQEARRHETDAGSPEVQISILTRRIADLTGHMRVNRKDFASRRGLLKMVGRRNRLLRYLSRENPEAYRALIKRLGLRK
jgi:small subunit ribosomal protein S15